MPEFLPGLRSPGVYLLIGAAILVFAVVRAVQDVLETGRDASPAKLALGQCLPVASIAWWAAFSGDADLALGVIFGSVVAGLSLVMGVILTGRDPRLTATDQDMVERHAKAWPFVLPISVLILLIGFGARFSLMHAAMVALLGLAVGGVWTGEHVRVSEESLWTSTSDDKLRVPRAILVLLLAGALGWVTVHGAADLSASRRGLSTGVIGVTFLSALMALPAVGTATFLSRTNRAGVAISAQVATALITLAGILPGSVLFWHIGRTVQWGRSSAAATQSAATQPHAIDGLVTFDWARSTPMPFPVGFWRVETVILAALALPLIPMALGGWRPGRGEGTAYIILYVFYLLLVTAANDQWH